MIIESNPISLSVVSMEQSPNLFEEALEFARQKYLRIYGHFGSIVPDYFAVAKHQGEIFGVAGISLSTNHSRFFFECTKDGLALNKLFGGLTNRDSVVFSEISRLAVDIPESYPYEIWDMIALLIAASCIKVFDSGAHHHGFVSSRALSIPAKLIGFPVHILGKPSPEGTEYDQPAMRVFLKKNKHSLGFHVPDRTLYSNFIQRAIDKYCETNHVEVQAAI